MAGGAYWLIDAISSYQHKDLGGVMKIPFQVWTLKVTKDRTAVLEMREDSNKPVLVKQVLHYTDFPLPEITMWVADGVLHLPSEH